MSSCNLYLLASVASAGSCLEQTESVDDAQRQITRMVFRSECLQKVSPGETPAAFSLYFSTVKIIGRKSQFEELPRSQFVCLGSR